MNEHTIGYIVSSYGMDDVHFYSMNAASREAIHRMEAGHDAAVFVVGIDEPVKLFMAR